MASKIFRWFDFSGGLQTASNQFVAQPNEVKKAVNVVFDNVGSIKKRNGYTQYKNQIAAGQSILGMAEIGGTSSQKVVACNSKLYYHYASSPSANWTATSSSLNSGDDWISFAYFGGYLFFSSTQSSLQLFLSSNVSSSATYVPSLHQGQSLVPYKSRLYIAFNTPRFVGYSDLASYLGSTDVITSLGWDTVGATYDNYFLVGEDRNAYVFSLNVIYNNLYCIKENSIWCYDSNTLTQIADIGTNCAKSVIEYNNKLYFMNRNGIYQFEGTQPVLISNPVQKYIDDINLGDKGNPTYSFFPNVNGGVNNNHLLWYIGDLATIGIKDVVLDYDVDMNTWTIHTTNDYITRMCVMRNDSYKTQLDLYIGDDNGKVYQWDSGMSDNTVAIECEVETNYYNFDSPEVIKQFKKLHIFSTTPGYFISYSVDYGEYRRLGFVKEKIQKFDMPSEAKGKMISLRIDESSADTTWQFDGFTLEYDEVGVA